jgi:hypothetical protein
VVTTDYLYAIKVRGHSPAIKSYWENGIMPMMRTLNDQTCHIPINKRKFTGVTMDAVESMDPAFSTGRGPRLSYSAPETMYPYPSANNMSSTIIRPILTQLAA